MVDYWEAGLEIPGDQYEAVQDFFNRILEDQYLSLLSAVELIWTDRFEKSWAAKRNVQTFISRLICFRTWRT